MAQNLINKVLLKKYRVDEFIAAGGMGAVYKVFDFTKNVFLAMKVLNLDLDDDPSVIKRFKREANAYRNLSHPNIVPFYGIEQTEKEVFILQKFIDGGSLKDILARFKNRPFPTQETLVVMKALCASLGYAHYKGVVHCDIKPGNILVDQGGNVFLTDFGIARHAESTTTSFADAGTPSYMSPEQILGKPVSPVTDIYGLGVVLYEMCTGQRPFRGTERSTDGKQASVKERIREAHLNIAPPNPRGIRPEISERLASVILRSLKKDPEERFQTTQELFAALCASCDMHAEQVPDRINPALVVHAAPETARDGADNGGIPPDNSSTREEVRNKVTLKPRFPGWVFVLGGVVLVAIIFMAGRGGFSPLPTSTPASGTVDKTSETTPFATYIPGNASPSTQTPTFDLATSTIAPSETPQTGTTKTSAMDGMVQVFVPAGEFLMGSKDGDLFTNDAKFQDEKPQHTVYLDVFWIDQTEITNAMYEKFVLATHYTTDAEQKGKGYITAMDKDASIEIPGANWQHPFGPGSNINGQGNFPVVQISWNDAFAYCNWVKGSLPTEAEWEKAARGTNGAYYPWGNDPPDGKVANTADLSLGTSYWLDKSVNFSDGFPKTAPVGSFPAGASPYQLLDMAGNVWEWVSDRYDLNFYYTSDAVARNPTGSQSGSKRGLRGGSYVNGQKNVRSSRRGSNYPNVPLDLYGFRCVRP